MTLMMMLTFLTFWRFRWRPFIFLVLSNPVVNMVFKWKHHLIHIFKPLIISVSFLLWQQFAVLLMYFCQQFKNVIKLSQVLFHHCQILLWVQQIVYYAWFSHQSFMQLASSNHKNWSLILQSFLSIFSGPFAISFSASVSSLGLFSISWWLPVWSTTISSFMLVKSSTHLSNPSLIEIFLIKSVKSSTLYYLT